jgi:AraC family transcriptional regulator
MPLKTDLQYETAQATPTISRAFDGFAVEHFEFQEDAPFDYVREGDTWYLSLHDVQLEAAEVRVSDGQRSERLDLSDTLTLLPPTARIEGWAKPLKGRHSFIALYFSPELLAPELGRLFETTQPQPVLYGRDRAVSLTMRKMTKLLREGHEGRMPLEQLAIVAACEAQGLLQQQAVVVRSTYLSPAQLNRATDYITANMTSDISLGDLAYAVGLSRFHFARAFATTTGMSPYAFLTTQRAKRAANLLASTRLPLEEVARESGLGTTAKLRRAMAKCHGATPSAYRRHHR